MRNYHRLFLFFALAAANLRPAERNAEEILKGVDAVRAPGPNFAFELTVVSTPKGKSPTTQKFTVSVKDLTKSLVRFTDPPENRGRVLLMVGQNLWIQIPSTNQPVRISPQQRLLGQVSNGDVARVVYSADYQPSLKGSEQVDGTPCNELELNAKTPEATYGRILLWADAANDRPLKAEFYAPGGKLLKTAVYKDYRLVLGKSRPMRTEIVDDVRTGDATTLDETNLHIDNRPDSDYEKDNLKYVH